MIGRVMDDGSLAVEAGDYQLLARRVDYLTAVLFLLLMVLIYIRESFIYYCRCTVLGSIAPIALHNFCTDLPLSVYNTYYHVVSVRHKT